MTSAVYAAGDWARLAYLAALGPSAPLVRPALRYPADAPQPSLSLAFAGGRQTRPVWCAPQMCGFGDGGAFDGVAWTIEPEAEDRALNLPPVTAEVLYYAACEAIRNAARHGRATDANGARPLHLCVQTVWREVLKITVEDDGTGVGSATSPWPGGGQGLALHSTLMAVVGGVLAIESQQGAYARVTLTLPEGIL